MRESRILDEMLTAMEAAQNATTAANSGGNGIIREALDNVRAMLAAEDRGWEIFSGANGDAAGGLTLKDLQLWSERIHESAFSGWMKRGFSLRSAYIWQDGIQYDGIPTESRGKGTNVQDRIDNPLNQDAFFSKQARTRREKRLYAEGFALWVGDDTTKILKAVPLEQITNTLSDPDDPAIIQAYRRHWTHRKEDGTNEDMVRWYYVDRYKDQAKDKVKFGTAQPELVAKDHTAFDMHANSVEGWAFGFPDALGAWIWNNYAKQAYMDGLDVSEAMASLIFKASSASSKGSQNQQQQFATANGAGGTATMGSGSDVVALSTAGKAFDFSQIREIVAVIATSLDLSVIPLTGNPGDAGSSYGSAATLDEPGRLTTEARRDEHVDLDLRVLRWMAGPTAAKAIKVYFHPLINAADQYRKVQSVVLKWQQGLSNPEDAAQQIDDIFGVPSHGGVPSGILIPNNKRSLARKDIDTDGSPAAAAPATAATPNGVQAAAPTQGKGGKQAGGNKNAKPTDTRGDILAK